MAGVLTQERVRELFDLDLETGVLRWKVRTSNRIKIGDVAGCLKGDSGYLVVRIDDTLYKVHRVIYLLVHGYTPENDIDHIDRNRLNNIPTNLREVSQSCNSRNADTPNTNTSGVKGVYWHSYKSGGGKWFASITANGGLRHLCFCSDFTEAVAHRLAAEQALDWPNCDSCSPAYQYIQSYLQGLK